MRTVRSAVKSPRRLPSPATMAARPSIVTNREPTPATEPAAIKEQRRSQLKMVHKPLPRVTAPSKIVPTTHSKTAAHPGPQTAATAECQPNSWREATKRCSKVGDRSIDSSVRNSKDLAPSHRRAGKKRRQRHLRVQRLTAHVNRGNRSVATDRLNRAVTVAAIHHVRTAVVGAAVANAVGEDGAEVAASGKCSRDKRCLLE